MAKCKVNTVPAQKKQSTSKKRKSKVATKVPSKLTAKTKPSSTPKRSLPPKTKLQRFAARLRESRTTLVALIVVGSIAAFGTYQVIQSSAYTDAQFANKRQNCRDQFPNVGANRYECYMEINATDDSQFDIKRQDCRDRFPNSADNRQNCLQRINNQQNAYEALKTSCNNQKRQVKDDGSGCGGCWDAFVDITPGTNNDACERKVECTKPHEFYNKDRNACGCEQGWARNAAGNCQEITNPTTACAGLNRQVSGSNCGPCLSGFVDVNGDPNAGNCEKKASCGNNEAYAPGNNTCVCKEGYVRTNGKCSKADTPEEIRRSCAALGRKVNANATACTTCLNDWVDLTANSGNDPCERKVSCTKANEFYNARENTCGCKQGFARQANGTCQSTGGGGTTTTVPQTPAQQCADQNRTFVASTGKCGPCVTGYFLNGTVCSKAVTGDPQTVQQYCQYNLHQTYNATSNSCVPKSCTAAYYWDESKSMCLLAKNAPPATVKAACTAQKRTYNASANQCGGCTTGLILVNGICQTVSPADIQKAKDTCAAARLTYVASTNSCGNSCVSGYLKNATGACIPTAGLSDAQIQALCRANHLEYDGNAKNCKQTCATGYAKNLNGACTPMQDIKKGCDTLNLQFDSIAGKCKTACKPGYIKNADLLCVDRAEEAKVMNERICRALGRKWIDPAASSPGASVPKKAFCSTTCIAPKETSYVSGPTNLSSYCKNNGAEGMGLSNIPKDECRALNRIYFNDINACSARCVTGYHLANKLCVTLVTVVDPTQNGPDECSVELESQTITDEEGNTFVIDGVCPDDEILPTCEEGDAECNAGTCVEGDATCEVDGGTCPVDDPTCETSDPGACVEGDATCEVDGGNDVAGDDGTLPDDGVDQLIDKDTCDLLGRLWVPGVEIDGVVTEGGCSTEACAVEGAELRAAGDSVYCEGSVQRITQQDCEEANRVWIDEVSGCAEEMAELDTSEYANTDEGFYEEYYDYGYSEGEFYEEEPLTDESTDSEDYVAENTTPKVSSSACQAPYTTYEQRDAENGGDRCRRPTVIERVKSVAKGVGNAVTTIASIPPRAICTLQDKKMWQPGKGCVTRHIPIVKIGSEAERKDSFNTSFDVNKATSKAASCDDIASVIADDDKDKFNCLSKSECKEQKGATTKVYAVDKETNKVFISRVCWTNT